MSNRTLIKGGIVLTQDEGLGELPNADVLIEDGSIAAVGPNLDAADARVIDASGDIVIPGFIDTHRHTWETSIRTCAPDFALITYFGSILDKFAPHYRPDDVYAANLWGSLECLRPPFRCRERPTQRPSPTPCDARDLSSKARRPRRSRGRTARWRRR